MDIGGPQIGILRHNCIIVVTSFNEVHDNADWNARAGNHASIVRNVAFLLELPDHVLRTRPKLLSVCKHFLGNHWERESLEHKLTVCHVARLCIKIKHDLSLDDS